MAGGDVEHAVQFVEERVDALLLVLNAHALDGQLDDVDGGERQVASPDRGLHTIAVLEHARAASHRGYLVQIALGVIGMPGLVLVVGRVQVDKVGEEAPRRHLARQLIQVVVRVVGQIAHTAFLLPNLDGEDGRRAVAHALKG